MVRLKVRIRQQSGGTQAFQFHNGSIKSKQSVEQKRAAEAFQFHNGSIKREEYLNDPKDDIVVSIPQWFD